MSAYEDARAWLEESAFDGTSEPLELLKGLLDEHQGLLAQHKALLESPKSLVERIGALQRNHGPVNVICGESGWEVTAIGLGLLHPVTSGSLEMALRKAEALSKSVREIR